MDDELHSTAQALQASAINEEQAATIARAIAALKYFAERIPATFVYAGIRLDRTGLLAGPRGEQISGRFGMARTGAFPRDAQWTSLIAALETSLRLHRHEPGTLTTLDSYLHQRTQGMIGSLLWLIRSAAIDAILDGTEKITRQSLDSVQADISSQNPPKKRR